MKQILTIAFVIFSVTSVWGQKLTLNIDGWGNDTVYVQTQPANRSVSGVRDTLIAQNGQVVVINHGTSPLMVSAMSQKSRVTIPGGWISPNAASIVTILMPNKNVTITGRLDGKVIAYTSTSDRFFTEYTKVISSLKPLEARIDSLQLSTRPSTDEQRQAFQSAFFSIVKEIVAVRIDYVSNNPDSEASLGVLLGLSTDNIAELLPTLTDRVKTGDYKSLTAAIEKVLEANKQKLTQKNIIATGNIAPAFTLTSLDGTPKSLADFRGKWVVLDFWGSWCSWCVKGFPAMKEAYSKYRNRTEFIGIACGDKPETWREAVEKYALPWTQLINNTSADLDVTKKYAVESYPTKIIIAPQGIIQYVSAGENSEFYAELDKLITK